MSATQARDGFWRTRSLPIGLLGVIGLILGGLALEYLVTHPDPQVWWHAEMIVVGGVSLAVVISAYWLAASDYSTDDLWVILGWTVGGVIAGSLLTGGIYAHQTVEGGSVAEPMFLFELLALIGSGIGLGLGVTWLSMSGRQVREVLDDTEPVESDAVLTLLSLLGGDTEPLQQRWVVLEYLVNNTQNEVPIDALAGILAEDRVPEYPSSQAAIQRLLRETHVPRLESDGLVEIREDIDTVRYVGPDSMIDVLHDDESRFNSEPLP